LESGEKMHYFIIRQDKSLTTAPKIISYKSSLFNKRNLTDKISIMYVQKNNTIDFVDFIDEPLLLVSDSFKEILKKYSPSFEYKAVVLTEPEKQVQQVYWNVELPEVKCLSPKTEYYPNGLIKKMVIDVRQAEGYSMFKINNKIETYCIIRLELAESILRRGMWGFVLDEPEEEV
jgi:hypothetical protein